MRPDGTITSLPLPNMATAGRAEVQDYFDNTWTTTEVLFASLQDTETFTNLPQHKLRHPLIFYYGHVAALYVNKMRVARLIDTTVDPFIEEFFQTGVDEMSWDDLSAPSLGWPAVSEITQYRREVYDLVKDLIATHPALAPTPGAAAAAAGPLWATEPVADESRRYWDHPLWSLFMSFEHERIHLETSSVLIRELPLAALRRPEEWVGYHPTAKVLSSSAADAGSAATVSAAFRAPQRGVDFPEANRLLPVAGGLAVTLGKERGFPSFGWDNEYGERTFELAPFAASEHMVTNGEFHEFVMAGGYTRDELWTEDGRQWRSFRNAKWPVWWESCGPNGLGAFHLRLTHEIVAMPWDWPVDVNAHEAKAYCAWLAERDGLSSPEAGEPSGYRLLTEPEHMALRGNAVLGANSGGAAASPTVDAALTVDTVLAASGDSFADEHGVNLNLAFGSQSPVTWGAPSPTGHRDVAGSAWEWAEDQLSALPGFKIHTLYEDFSTPCFDGEHSMILGGSWASTGANGASRFSRFAFRPHFFQHAGFRVVRPSPDEPAGKPPTSCDGCAPPFRGKLADRNQLAYNSREEAAKSLAVAVEQHFGTEQRLLPFVESAVDGQSFVHKCAGLLSDLFKVHGTSGEGKATLTAMDLGCSVGGAAFALSSEGFEQVLGIDIEADAIAAARNVHGGKAISVGSSAGEQVVPSAGAKHSGMEFMQADAMCIPANLHSFDAVLCADLLEQLQAPSGVLMRMGGELGLVAHGGVLLLTSTYAYDERSTPREAWVGGADNEDPTSMENAASAIERVAALLGPEFELLDSFEIPRVERVNDRSFNYHISHATAWKRTQRVGESKSKMPAGEGWKMDN